MLASDTLDGQSRFAGLAPDIGPYESVADTQPISTYASYQTYYNIGVAEEDDDNDQLPNLYEYYLGLNPIVAHASANFIWMDAEGIAASFNFLSPIVPTSDVRIEVQQSNDLQTWNTLSSRNGNEPWSNPGALTITPHTDGMEHISVHEPMNTLKSSFYRLWLETVGE